MSSEKGFKNKTLYNIKNMTNNIMDQSVPEIKVPILKPVKVPQTVSTNTVEIPLMQFKSN